MTIDINICHRIVQHICIPVPITRIAWTWNDGIRLREMGGRKGKALRLREFEKQILLKPKLRFGSSYQRAT